MSFRKSVVVWVVAILGVAFLLMMLTGCQKDTQNPAPDPYADLTIENVMKTCGAPVEAYPIMRIGFPVEALVMRHKKCQGVDDMFMVVWPGEDTKKYRVAAELLMLMYLEFQADANPNETLEADLIKVAGHDDNGEKSHAAFYKLTTKNKCEDGRCTKPSKKEGASL